jgi:hypothetical protein
MRRLALLACLLAGPAAAEVRFGGHVFVGGHDESHQTFDSRHRGEYYLYKGQPHPPGCVVRRDADGGRTKVCRYKTLR